jgi:septal ring factor EnvC (AmiA/AmiB activator)
MPHYSSAGKRPTGEAPTGRDDLRSAQASWIVAIVALGGWLLAPVATARSEAEAKAELARVEARIRAVTAAVHQQAARRDAVARALEDAEASWQEAKSSLETLRERTSGSRDRLAELRDEEHRTRRGLLAERTLLAAQLRAAYEGGRAENLKLLLSADDPAQLGRALAYFGYVGRARLEKMAHLREQLEHLQTIEQAASAEADRLAGLEHDQTRQVASLNAARQKREHALAALKADIDTRNTELKRLQANAAALEDLIARLGEALKDVAPEDYAFDGGRREPFERVRGHLPWPVPGKLEVRYGETRAGGMRSQGWLLGTAPGASVHAPYYGRVVYADWLPGLGLLLILDHGQGYLTLYGHNEVLYRKVGEVVTPGTLLAAAGKGPPQPQLYFEIRHGTKTLDPAEWLHSRTTR